MRDSTSSADLEKDVEAERAALQRTLGQLRDNMKPARMAGEFLTSVVGRKYDTAAVSGRGKSVPESLLNLGAAVLFGSSMRALKRVDAAPAAPQPTTSDTSLKAGLRAMGDEADAVHNRLSANLDRADAGVADATSQISASAEGLRRQARRSTGLLADLGARANDAAARHAITSDVTRLVIQKPFVWGALGVAIGAAVGMSFAISQTEHELMGASSAAVKKSARAMARDSYDQLKQVASETIDDLKQTVVDHGLSLDNASGLVDDVGGTLRNAAHKAADRTRDDLSPNA